MSADSSTAREAQLLINIGRAKEAIPLLIRAISADPQSVRSRCLLSLAHFKLGRYEESLAAADEAVATSPVSEWPHRLRTMNLMRLKRYPEALSAACLAASLGPNVPEALHLCALCQADNGKFQDARITADALMQLAPDNSLSHHTAGLIALREKRWTDAETHCRKAVSIEPTCWEQMNNLGLALKRQGKKKEAIERFHDTMRLNPQSETVRKNLRETVASYVSVSTLGVYVVFQVIVALVISTDHTYLLLAAGLGFAAFITILAGDQLWQRKRLAELGESVALFYETEMSRKYRLTRSNVVRRTLSSIAALAIVSAIIFVFMTTTFDNGPRLPFPAFGVLLSCVLATELITTARRK